MLAERAMHGSGSFPYAHLAGRLRKCLHKRRTHAVQRGALVLEQGGDEKRMPIQFQRTGVILIVYGGNAQAPARDGLAETAAQAVTAVVALLDRVLAVDGRDARTGQ